MYTCWRPFKSSEWRLSAVMVVMMLVVVVPMLINNHWRRLLDH